MVFVPSQFFDRRDLTSLERALFPLVVYLTVGWGRREAGTSLPDVAEFIVDVDVKRIGEALDSLCAKGLLQHNRTRDRGQVKILYAVNAAFVEQVNSPSQAPMPASSPVSGGWSNAFLDMPRERFVALHQNALSLLAREGLSKNLFDEYVDDRRRTNWKSHDWDSDFSAWLRKKAAAGSIAVGTGSRLYPVLASDQKPSEAEMKIVHYFFKKHLQINPHFQAPSNLQMEGHFIKVILETTNYRAEDILRCVDWLFSPKGDWYRPKVVTCEQLMRKMNYIAGHIVSYADAKEALPGHVNIYGALEHLNGDD